jgi:signal transduction histidine kinase
MYPQFLPSAKSIKQGLYLFFLNIPFLFILISLAIAYQLLEEPLKTQILMAIGAFFIFCLIFVGLILGYIDYLFFGNHKLERQNLTFLPPNKNIIEGHLLILFSIFSYIILLVSNFTLKSLFPNYGLMIEGSGLIVWIITASYCFYLRQIFTKV